MTQATKAISARIDYLDLSSSDLHYIVGWLTSSAPLQLADALNALEAQRERDAQYRARPVDPCANGCSDPAAHAEGGHDV